MRKYQALIVMVMLSNTAFAASTTAKPTTSSPSPTVIVSAGQDQVNSSKDATSVNAKVSISPDAAQLDQVKTLFHHAKYKYLRHMKNSHTHLSASNQGDGENGA